VSRTCCKTRHALLKVQMAKMNILSCSHNETKLKWNSFKTVSKLFSETVLKLFCFSFISLCCAGSFGRQKKLWPQRRRWEEGYKK